MASKDEPAPLDLVVIGGGINGAGIARDAAGRGLSVALFEQGDLAEHTSSKSTKLIHGGLRYLEYCEFRLVREALKEREILLKIAPHIAAPQRFVLPHMPGTRPAWMVRLGLLLYDRLGGRISLPRSQAVRLSGTVLGAPLKAGIQRGFMYSDASVDDARLVVLNARDAADRGAQIHVRTKVLSAQRSQALWHIKVQGEDGRCRNHTAKALVNAAGPWVDNVCNLASSGPAKAKVRLIKGSHIVVRKLFDGDHAYLLQNSDGRVLFAIPYQDEFTLIGTTDIPFEGNPSTTAISADETRYLCEGISRVFNRAVCPADVVWAYSGVRPLYDDAAQSASAVTRDYVLSLDTGTAGQAPLLSIYGGKITTYRRLAEHALEKLLPHVAVRRSDPWTARISLPGGEMGRDCVTRQLAERYPYLPLAHATRLARTYGTKAFAILGAAPSMEDLGKMFGAGLTEAEVDYLVDQEWVRRADDVLWRRTKLGLHMTPAEQEEFRNWFADRMASRAA